MNNNPYQKFEEHELILRDELALDRTILANERTILAYVRTAFVFFVSGVTLIKLFPGNQLALLLGYICFPITGIILMFGFAHFFKTRERLRSLREKNGK